jgi:uncharacterized protein (DUF1015 family)
MYGGIIMARIEPFKGVRPAKDKVQEVSSPPYDVLNSKEAKELTKDNPYSFLRIIKPEVDLPDGVDLYSDEVYAKARENFDNFRKDGILIQDETRNFYVYKQTWKGHEASCRDYLDDVVKKHEFTRPVKENDRMRHIETLNANTGPVFLTFKQRDDVDALFARAMEKEPEYDFETRGTGVRHIFYVVDDGELVEDIRQTFAGIDYLYVADGHHRSAAGTNVKVKREKDNPNHTGDEEYNFFLSVIFPHNQMKILSYNRVVKDLNGMCKAEFFGKIAAKFDYEDAESKEPQSNKEFCLYIEGKWYKLTAKEGSYDAADPVKELDVAILQDNLLDPVLGIKDPRKDDRVNFIGGIRGTQELEKLVDNGEYRIAIAMYPTNIEELFDVADSGQVMPPKSTWFEPKLESGLVVHLLED